MKQKIYAMIPARIGSTRLKMKNLALINGKPLIYYAIKAAKDSGVFERIIVNSDSECFSKIAERYDVDFYHRPEDLGGSDIKSDDVVADFIRANPEAHIVAWVNPISPMQTGKEIKSIIDYFIKENLNSLITVCEQQVHCLHNEEPVNFSLEGKFEQTQDLNPVQAMVYSIMMWRTTSFLEVMETKGHAILHGKIGYFPVNKLSSIIVKTSLDLLLADSLMNILKSDVDNIKYDELVYNL